MNSVLKYGVKEEIKLLGIIPALGRQRGDLFASSRLSMSTQQVQEKARVMEMEGMGGGEQKDN